VLPKAAAVVAPRDLLDLPASAVRETFAPARL
jgi:hypothetical protein